MWDTYRVGNPIQDGGRCFLQGRKPHTYTDCGRERVKTQESGGRHEAGPPRTEKAEFLIDNRLPSLLSTQKSKKKDRDRWMCPSS